jgi:hypothetical protein
MSDLGSPAWHRFVCLEPALTGNTVSLAAGQSWSGAQSLRVSTL